MSDAEFVFADPPPQAPRGRRGAWSERARIAQQHPGRWIRWEATAAAKYGPNATTMRKTLRGAGLADVDVAVRRIDGKWYVFMRATGQAEPAPPPAVPPASAPKVPTWNHVCPEPGCTEAFLTRAELARHRLRRHPEAGTA